jgi:hypothetical protein
VKLTCSDCRCVWRSTSSDTRISSCDCCRSIGHLLYLCKHQAGGTVSCFTLVCSTTGQWQAEHARP